MSLPCFPGGSNRTRQDASYSTQAPLGMAGPSQQSLYPMLGMSCPPLRSSPPNTTFYPNPSPSFDFPGTLSLDHAPIEQGWNATSPSTASVVSTANVNNFDPKLAQEVMAWRQFIGDVPPSWGTSGHQETLPFTFQSPVPFQPQEPPLRWSLTQEGLAAALPTPNQIPQAPLEDHLIEENYGYGRPCDVATDLFEDQPNVRQSQVPVDTLVHTSNNLVSGYLVSGTSVNDAPSPTTKGPSSPEEELLAMFDYFCWDAPPHWQKSTPEIPASQQPSSSSETSSLDSCTTEQSLATSCSDGKQKRKCSEKQPDGRAKKRRRGNSDGAQDGSSSGPNGQQKKKLKRPYKCRVCKRGSSRRDSLKRHVRQQHPNLPESEWERFNILKPWEDDNEDTTPLEMFMEELAKAREV